MSSPSRRWVKVWHEILSDHKFQDLSLEQQARFYNLLVYMSVHGNKGNLQINPPARSLISLFQCTDFDHLLVCLKTLPNIKIETPCDNAQLGVTFINWSKYQIDSTSYDRVQRYREKHNETLHVTPIDKSKNKSKNKIRKENTLYSPNSDEFRLSAILLSYIKNRDTTFKSPDLQSWSKHIDLMIRVDGRLVAEIENIIKLCQQDVFWQNNILSTDKLRKQFDQLKLKLLNKTATTANDLVMQGKILPL